MSLKRIDEIFHFEKGILQSSKCIPGDYDFITASSDWKTHNEYTHDCEALIFAAAASGSLGRTHYVNGKFVSSDLCFIITPKDPVNFPVDLRFYHILFNELKVEIVRNTKAGTSKEAIGLGSFGKYKLPYFDIDKQIEIKNRFVNSEVTKEGLSTELTLQLDLVKKLRQQLLQDAVQGKLVPQNPKDEPASELLKKIKAEKQKLIAEGKLKKEKELPPIKAEEVPFEIPENWIWCKLGEMVSLITSGSRNWNRYYAKEGVLFIRSQNIKPTYIDLTNQAFVNLPNSTEGKRTAVQKEDILITITGAGVSNAGRLAEIDFDEGYVSQHVALIRMININLACWIHFCIISNGVGKAQFSNLIYGDKPGLNLVQLNSLKIPIPPLAEQIRIVQKLDELMQTCNALEASIKERAAQNEQLLQQVLREALRKV